MDIKRFLSEQHLTPKQVETALLVLRGLSNREISEKLFVSPKTVKWRLTAVFAKLNVRDRKELAAFFIAKSGILPAENEQILPLGGTDVL